jgi:hypothetical protein
MKGATMVVLDLDGTSTSSSYQQESHSQVIFAPIENHEP